MLMSTLIAFTVCCLGGENLVGPQLCVVLQQERACGMLVHVREVITHMQGDEMHI